jgi:hydrogenase expression/formation protein HypE
VACELLGFDPLHVANEGKVVCVVEAGAADAALAVLRGSERGREAAVIGEVTAGDAGRVVLHTQLGTSRVLEMPSGELLPRIC